MYAIRLETKFAGTRALVESVGQRIPGTLKLTARTNMYVRQVKRDGEFAHSSFTTRSRRDRAVCININFCVRIETTVYVDDLDFVVGF